MIWSSRDHARPAARADKLLARPAPGTTQANLVGQVVAHLNLHGNAYVGKLRPGGEGAVTQLWCAPPDRVVPELRAGVPVYTFTDARGRVRLTVVGDAVQTEDGERHYNGHELCVSDAEAKELLQTGSGVKALLFKRAKYRGRLRIRLEQTDGVQVTHWRAFYAD